MAVENEVKDEAANAAEMESMVGAVVEGLNLGGPPSSEEEVPDPAAPPLPNAEEAGKGAAPAAPSAPSSEAAPASPAPDPASPASPTAPPKAWGAKTAEAWATLPPAVKAEIAKREDDIQKGFSQLNQVAQIGHSFQQAIAPYIAPMQQYDIDPAKHAAQLFGIHRTLALGTPAEKSAMMGQLMREFQISPEMLAGVSTEAPYVDPAVQALTAQLQSLQSSQQQMVTRAQQQEAERLTTEVEQFAAKNPHFETVSEDIARLLSTKAAAGLQQAYDMAIWSNPATRALLLGEQEKARQDAETKARSERALKARASTAANLRSSPKGKGPTAPLGSIEDTLKATADRLFADAS